MQKDPQVVMATRYQMPPPPPRPPHSCSPTMDMHVCIYIYICVFSVTDCCSICPHLDIQYSSRKSAPPHRYATFCDQISADNVMQNLTRVIIAMCSHRTVVAEYIHSGHVRRIVMQETLGLYCSLIPVPSESAERLPILRLLYLHQLCSCI